MGNPAVTRLKRALVRRYPDWIAAFHEARLRRQLGRRPLTETSLGFRFAGPENMQSGSFEPRELEFLIQGLSEADVFVDVGANAGYYTCIARQRGIRVIAIEPAVQNLELLFRNISANGWTDVEVFPLGIAEQPGLGTLYGGGTGASLVTRWAGVSETWKHTIPLSTLDVLLAGRFPGQRLVIKVDVEGAEYRVLSGAIEVLARQPAPVWLVEVCFTENFQKGAVNPHFGDVFRLFWRAGYSATSLEAGRRVTEDDVARWLRDGRRDFGYVSYVFQAGSDRSVDPAETPSR